MKKMLKLLLIAIAAVAAFEVASEATTAAAHRQAMKLDRDKVAVQEALTGPMRAVLGARK